MPGAKNIGTLKKQREKKREWKNKRVMELEAIFVLLHSSS